MFLKYRLLPDFSTLPNTMRSKRKMNAFNGFMMWINNINDNYFWRPLMVEQPLVNSLYGGTLDALLEIGGKIYIVDFKTSNQMSWKYILQVAAYRRSLRELYGINVDGLCIVRFEKNTLTFPEETMLDLSKPDVLEFINGCENMFLSLVYSYYNRTIVENYYKYCTGSRRI